MMSVLADLLRARASAEPDATALVVAAVSLTYGSWDRRSDAVCRGLRHKGVVPGDRVVLCLGARRWIDVAVAYAGLHKAGAVPVLVGPSVFDEVLGRVVARSEACGVVRSSRPRSSDVLAGTSAWSASPAELEDVPVGADLPAAEPPELAHISCSLGPLQAPRLTSARAHEILVALVQVDDAAPTAASAPLFHAFAPASETGSRLVWLPLRPRSGPVIVLPTLDPRTLCTLTAGHQAARWSLVPATAGWLVGSGALDDHDLASIVRLVVVDGRVSPALHARLAAGLPTTALMERAAPSSFLVESTVPETANPTKYEGGGDEEPSIPVASSQEGMLWQEQFAPGSQNLPPLVRRYQGRLDATALERALAEIVRRHEPLRTTFELRGGRPNQVVAPAGAPLRRLDLSEMAPDARQGEVATLLAGAGRPFDLVDGPLFEACLVRLAPDDHLVVLRVHHSVYDDWSVSVFRRELSALYRAYAAGEASPLAELPLSFSDFSRGQHRRLAGPAGAAELDWWQEYLAGAPLSLQLPIDDPDRPEGSPQASAEPVSVDLAAELSARLRALARQERTTVFMTMLAAFEVLLHRYSGQSDLLAATVVANRDRVELEGMIGCFTKKVLVRLDGSGDPTFAELLPRVRTAVVGALSHQALPFETVLQRSLGARAATHGLVPQVAVMFQGVTPQTEDVVLPGLTTSGFDTSATTARTHFVAGDAQEWSPTDAVSWGGGLYLGTFLILSVVEEGEGIALAARGAFHRPSVERLLTTFETLLGDIVAHPTRRVSELRLLDAGERAERLRGSGAGDGVVPPTRPTAGASAAGERITIGGAFPGGTMAVLDAGGGVVPERVTGELHLGGPGTPPARLLGTGLLARYLPGDRIELLGTATDIVDLHGFRVSRPRIASVLRSCPGLADAEVVLGNDVAGEPHLSARVVAAEGAEVPSLGELQAELWSRLPGYAWPSAMSVVGHDDQVVLGGQQAGALPAPAGSAGSPEGELLAEMWAEERGVERIPVDENYWQSFSFLEAAHRARDAGVDLSDEDVSRNRTLSSLAAAWAAQRRRRR